MCAGSHKIPAIISRSRPIGLDRSSRRTVPARLHVKRVRYAKRSCRWRRVCPSLSRSLLALNSNDNGARACNSRLFVRAHHTAQFILRNTSGASWTSVSSTLRRCWLLVIHCTSARERLRCDTSRAQNQLAAAMASASSRQRVRTALLHAAGVGSRKLPHVDQHVLTSTSRKRHAAASSECALAGFSSALFMRRASRGAGARVVTPEASCIWICTRDARNRTVECRVLCRCACLP